MQSENQPQPRHPTDGLCKRCGQPLLRLWMPDPFREGEQIAERWCSDECYAIELLEKSQQACRAYRLRTGGGQSREKEEAE